MKRAHGDRSIVLFLFSLAIVGIGLASGCSSTAASDAAATDGAADVAGDAPGDAGRVVCGTITCAAGQICVRTTVQGGACLIPADGGACPAGFSGGGGLCCVRDPSWACAPRPSGCGATLTCGCAAATSCTGGQTCFIPSDSEIDCSLLAP